MTTASPSLAQIWRHPIKAHGAEALETVNLTAGETLPWDRVWAVPHEAAKTDGTNWVSCRNFSRGAGVPKLMAIDATLDAAKQVITLTHPDLSPISFSPDQQAAEFLNWVSSLTPEGRPRPTGIIRASGQGITDQSKPWLSILNLASLRDLSEKLGQPLDPRRFRGNLWIDGIPAWGERGLLGKSIRIGDVELNVTEHIGRCRATEANPDTGDRDLDTLGALKQNWGHTDFGVFAEVTKGGTISVSDKVEIQ
ncbi:MOSC domain-containing protein [Halocynthiibacter sp. C4]|uniref:MOSC domain-containing protein n=1 Tax=Halocynthiibacter sp. C4 TaxID=2992758 RepID=UPI00237BDE08|nr:MOSC domain-containing protein [Halocynthiibacter sp. C4]MDE0588490.1 MOSC domain-containing protein [Halocynthiibacter sp. C4]